MTTLWDGDCIWVSEAAYNEQAYNFINQSTTDICQPCWTTGIPCGAGYLDYSFMSVTNRTYCPEDYVCPFSLRHAAFRRLMAPAQTPSAAAAGTGSMEGYAGTFALPSNPVSVQDKQNLISFDKEHMCTYVGCNNVGCVPPKLVNGLRVISPGQNMLLHTAAAAAVSLRSFGG
jgi:hypothetical protein